jgi:acyl carrier protein
MSNEEKYAQVFMDTFSVERDALGEKFVYQCVPAWDSVGHMGLIAALEDTFDIMLETDDIIDFSGYDKGKETLTKYGVQF